MQEILINNFKGRVISTFFWREKICFFPVEITEALGYSHGPKTIQDCIKKEFFEEGEEYFILKGEELRLFKENINDLAVEFLSKTARLIIFTEIGLYGFLQYSQKKEARGFKKWIRSNVLPSIRVKGYYSINDDENNCDTISNLNLNREPSVKVNLEESNLEKIKVANETFKIIEELLDNEEDSRKVKILDSIYNYVGININIREFEEKFLGIHQIAMELGIYDEKENLNYEAIEEIVRRIGLVERKKEYESKNLDDFSGEIIKYSRSILEKITEWIVENEKPILLAGRDKEIVIVYK